MTKTQELFKNLGYELTETEYSLRYVKSGKTEYDDCVIELSILDFGWDFTNLWIPLFFCI